MKKLLLFLLFPLSLFGQGTKISDMTSATSLTGAEYVPIVQTTNKKATVSLLRGWSSIGTASQLLRVNAGATALEFFTPTWLTNPLTTTGDIIYSSSGTTGARLGIGGAGTFLRSDGSIPAWSTLTIPNTISALSIPVVNTANVLTSVTPSAGQSVRVNAGGTAWEAFTPGAGGGTPGGSDTEVQFNDGGSFGGDAGFVYNKTTNVGTIGGLNVSGLTSGELVATDGSKNLQSLAVATYPSLTELSYVKGLTSAAQTQLNDKWSLASGGTLTGANTITGTTTNILKGVFNSLGTTQTNGAGLWLANNTAAAAGAQQFSPSLVLEGQGWKTNATAASQPMRWAIVNQPVQGTSNPTQQLLFQSSTNGAAYSTILTLASNGNLTMAGGTLRASTVTAISGDNLTLSPGSSAGKTEIAMFTPTGIGAFIFASANEVNKTSGDVGSVNLTHGFAPTSGTATYYGFNVSNTINMTGGANGKVSIFRARPTLTAAASVTGYEYTPTVTSVSGTHLSFHATAGEMLIPASSYINWGSTSGSSGYGIRDNSGIIQIKNSGGSWSQPSITDFTTPLEGSYTGGLQTINTNVASYLSDGQIAYVEVDCVLIQSSGTPGSTGIAFKLKGVFRKASGTVTQIGSSVLDEVIATWNDTGDSYSASPSLSVSGGAINFTQNLTTTKTLAYKYLVKTTIK